MTLLYSDGIFLEHDTGSHPENAGRLRAVTARLDAAGLPNRCRRADWQPATLEQLARVHDPDYVAAVKQFAADGGGRIEVDTLVSPRSYDVALRAAGAVCDAVQRVVAADEPAEKTALCLVRPPGHHALGDAAMGFCLFNNIAIGARLATRELGLDHVLVIDWDVHHGNGTQASFWTDPTVGFLSIHRWPFYPGTGDADETGGGDGLGTTVNLPTAFGTPPREFLARFESAVNHLADKLQPQLLLISAGFDAHREDPVGSLELESEHFVELTKIVLALASEHCQGRLVSVLEGGYNPQRLAECVELHLSELLAGES